MDLSFEHNGAVQANTDPQSTKDDTSESPSKHGSKVKRSLLRVSEEGEASVDSQVGSKHKRSLFKGWNHKSSADDNAFPLKSSIDRQKKDKKLKKKDQKKSKKSKKDAIEEEDSTGADHHPSDNSKSSRLKSRITGWKHPTSHQDQEQRQNERSDHSRSFKVVSSRLAVWKARDSKRKSGANLQHKTRKNDHVVASDLRHQRINEKAAVKLQALARRYIVRRSGDSGALNWSEALNSQGDTTVTTVTTASTGDYDNGESSLIQQLRQDLEKKIARNKKLEKEKTLLQNKAKQDAQVIQDLKDTNTSLQKSHATELQTVKSDLKSETQRLMKECDSLKQRLEAFQNRKVGTAKVSAPVTPKGTTSKVKISSAALTSHLITPASKKSVTEKIANREPKTGKETTKFDALITSKQMASKATVSSDILTSHLVSPGPNKSKLEKIAEEREAIRKRLQELKAKKTGHLSASSTPKLSGHKKPLPNSILLSKIPKEERVKKFQKPRFSEEASQVHFIPRLEEMNDETFDALYYTEDECAEFRHDAFMDSLASGGPFLLSSPDNVNDADQDLEEETSPLEDEATPSPPPLDRKVSLERTSSNYQKAGERSSRHARTVGGDFEEESASLNDESTPPPPPLNRKASLERTSSNHQLAGERSSRHARTVGGDPSSRHARTVLQKNGIGNETGHASLAESYISNESLAESMQSLDFDPTSDDPFGESNRDSKKELLSESAAAEKTDSSISALKLKQKFESGYKTVLAKGVGVRVERKNSLALPLLVKSKSTTMLYSTPSTMKKEEGNKSRSASSRLSASSGSPKMTTKKKKKPKQKKGSSKKKTPVRSKSTTMLPVSTLENLMSEEGNNSSIVSLQSSTNSCAPKIQPPATSMADQFYASAPCLDNMDEAASDPHYIPSRKTIGASGGWRSNKYFQTPHRFDSVNSGTIMSPYRTSQLIVSNGRRNTIRDSLKGALSSSGGFAAESEDLRQIG